jgi:hypothetical protein
MVSEYGRDMVNQFRREKWRNIIKKVSIAQKNKYENNNNTNTSTTTINTSIIAKRRGRPPGKRAIQSYDISPIKGAAKRRTRVPDLYIHIYIINDSKTTNWIKKQETGNSICLIKN